MKRFFSLAITIAVAIAYLFVPIVNAGGADPTTQIAGHNLSLEDRVNIVYYVQSQEVPTDAEEGLLVWLDEPDLYAYGTEDYKITKFIRSGQYKLFYFNELAAKQMTVEVKAMSYIKSGDDIYCSELDSYSIAEYCNKKLSSTTVGADGTTTLGSVVKSILKYGAASQKYLGYNMDNLAWEGEDYTIQSCVIDENGHLIITYTTGIESDVGIVKGIDGRGIETMSLDDAGYLMVYYTDGTSQQLYLSTNDTDKFIFILQDDGTYWVGLGRTNTDRIIIVPESYNGIAVTGILPHGFQYDTFLEEVYLPDSVTTIGEFAFAECHYLKKVEGDAVDTVHRFAFYECDSLEDLFASAENQEWSFRTSRYYYAIRQYNNYSNFGTNYEKKLEHISVSLIIRANYWTLGQVWTNGQITNGYLLSNGDTWYRD